MKDKKKLQTWEGAWRDLEAAYERSCRPIQKKVPKGYVFDENKSVRWNAEQVEKNNAEVQKEAAGLQRERSLAINEATDAIVALIVDAFHGKINEQQARLIYNIAYDRGHSGGRYEIEAQLNEFMSAFSGFIEMGEITNDSI